MQIASSTKLTKLAIRPRRIESKRSNRFYSMMQYVESGIKIEYKSFPFTRRVYIYIHKYILYEAFEPAVSETIQSM